MTFSYYRKSQFDLAQTMANVKKEAVASGLTVVGEVEILNGEGQAVLVCNPHWLGNLMSADSNLVGLLPCSVVGFIKDKSVVLGTGNPAVLVGVSRDPAVAQLASEAEAVLRGLINKSAGVGEMKPIKIKLYSTQTCPYCKMEKTWLETNKVDHEVIYVDLNQNEAETMVAKTGQMGVPVTEIQYDEGEPEYVVGFDQAKLASILGLK